MENEEYDNEQNESENAQASTSKRLFVKESVELSQLLDNMKVLAPENESNCSSVAARCIEIISKYQSQGNVLDPILERIVMTLMSQVQLFLENQELAKLKGAMLLSLCRVLYTLVKVRGYKTIERFFPNQVSLIESAVLLLSQQDPQDFDTWEIRYVLLLWLSVLVLVPFNMSTIDSNENATAATPSHGKSATLIHKLVDLGKRYLEEPGKTRDAASILLARVLTRPDLISSHLVQFFEWSSRVILGTDYAKMEMQSTAAAYQRIGVLMTLAHVFVIGKRQDLLPNFQIIHQALEKVGPLTAITGSLDRKLYVKVLQRMCLTFLKPRVAAWRYQRGQRALFIGKSEEKPESNQKEFTGTTNNKESNTVHNNENNFKVNDNSENQNNNNNENQNNNNNENQNNNNNENQNNNNNENQKNNNNENQKNNNNENENNSDENEEDFLDPDEIPHFDTLEGIIQTLLDGLQDRDTIVRWSCAKGVGRITGRLGRGQADDVVHFVLDLFQTSQESCDAWHGGCLALAELARRGLLLPKRLPEVVPVVLSALKFDEQRGAHSVGAHVRDAACYVCWAFARAYAPEVMRPYATDVAAALVVATVFDREVNCRRAASAAFQENTGRQGGLIPHGIDIITAADYFSVSTRQNSYLKVGLQIAVFPEYQLHMITHLLEEKIGHWDRAIRELVAKTLGSLVKLDPELFVRRIVPDLLVKALDEELFLRHGAILGLAEVVLALSETKTEIERFNEILEIIPTLEARRMFRGKGGELVRFATCRLIYCLSLCKRTFANLKPGPIVTSENEPPVRITKTFGQIMQLHLDENLKHPNDEIQEAAVKALTVFTRNCYSLDPPKKAAFDLVSRYAVTATKDTNFSARRGFTSALCLLPKQFLTAFPGPDTSPLLESVLDSVLQNLQIESDPEQRDPETRRNAARGLANLAHNVPELFAQPGLVEKLFGGLVAALNDFSTDKRGDVGSWVREAALSSFQVFFNLLLKHNPDLCDETKCKKFLHYVVRSCFEKIDKLRVVAGQVFQTTFLQTQFTLPHFPQREAAWQLFHNEATRIQVQANRNFSNEFPPTNENKNHEFPSTNENKNHATNANKNHEFPSTNENKNHEFPSTNENKNHEFLSTNENKNHEFPSTNENKNHEFLSNKIEDTSSMEKTTPVLIQWNKAEEAYQAVLPILALEHYRHSVLSGIVPAVGGAPSMLVLDTPHPFLNFVKRLAKGNRLNSDPIRGGSEKSRPVSSKATVVQVADAILELVEQSAGDERIVFPAFKLIAQFFANSCFGPADLSLVWASRLVVEVQKELVRTKDIMRPLSCANLLCWLLLFDGKVRQDVVKTLLRLLLSSFPRVRRHVATEMYTRLLIDDYIIVNPADSQKAMELLSQTKWDDKLSPQLKQIRNQIANLFGFQMQQTK